MSSVKVFNQLNGKWSEPIVGVDEKFFVECILESGFVHTKFCTHGMKECNEEWFKLMTKVDLPMKHVELDFNPVLYKDIIDVEYYRYFFNPDDGVDELCLTKLEEEAVRVKTDVSFKNINLAPHTILVGVKNLRRLIEDMKASYGYWVPVIEKIIEMGDIPSDASDDYMLIMKFLD